MNKEADLLIIGGGVVGTAIARELAKYKLDITLIEKKSDVGSGVSKANTGLIHAGFNAEASKIKGRLNVEGNKMYDQLKEELKFPFERRGALVVAQDEDDIPRLESILENGKKNGVPDLEIIKGEKLFELEADLNPDSVAALYAPTAAIVCPYELTVALAENAAVNGVEVLLNTAAKSIEVKKDHKVVYTNRGQIKAKVVINAAGLYADEVAKMVGIDDIDITPRKGEYHVYDKKLGSQINHTIFPVPTGVSKGIVVTPTVDGNLLVGPNAQEIDDKTDISTTSQGLENILQGAKKTLPKLSRRGVINQFTGLRPAYKETGDFIIEASDKVDGFINVAGIQSPGLSSAPAIAKMVREILAEILGGLEANKDFNPYRQEVVRFRELSVQEQAKLIKEDPRYGEVICRCEMVTKGEIIDSINRPVGANSVRAVRRRTRAGMGRCQGGFCGPRVVDILVKELGIDHTEVTEDGGDSRILLERAKESLLKEVSE
ncbi:NAD(P)/FAD-dependent oxidoreductase [Halonatronum saccharophilum]|uniref:NAD(P)/FAD-dependent oxidoreductase n=1 Tax=Halonatronum saccharophilum TaxID=150060 RepID=UPI000484E0E2|nr:NAD(P)/FAD-dependent oxidoreductase [Halonatronum saccharophilum]